MREKNKKLNLKHCFKPYKGVSSNKGVEDKKQKIHKVSNPIREYLQIVVSLVL